MQLDLSQLGRHGRADEHLDRTYEASAFAGPDVPEDEEFQVASPVHLVLDVHKTGDAFRVTGRVQATLRLECGRCLEAFTIPVDSVFELRYVSQESNTGADEHEIHEDDLTTAYYRENTLDLADLMREQFLLALPMKPLCREDCKGLCPECGTNLNTSTCGCAPRWEDPRLSALQGLLDRNKEQ
jgi:uncharacterized protein